MTPVVCDKKLKVIVQKGHKIDPVKHMGAKDRFDYPTTLDGVSTWKGSDSGPITVYHDPATGAKGATAATYVLSHIDELMAYCDAVFGVQGKSGNIIIAPDFGGAYHAGCSFNADGGGSDWYESVGDPPLVFGLAMAEISESYMGLQNLGWNCGGSGGEGLSRYLAEIVSGGPDGALAAYSSASSWDGTTNYIDKDQGTDQDYPSIGCSILYIWWVTSLGFTPAQIVQAGESDGTLASNYAKLTGKPKAQAWPDFQKAISTLGPPSGYANDNPFNVATPPYPDNGPIPVPCPIGQHRDPVSGLCVPDVPVPPVCPTGQHWDASVNACVPDVVPTNPTGNVVVLTTDMIAGTYAIAPHVDSSKVLPIINDLLALLGLPPVALNEKQKASLPTKIPFGKLMQIVFLIMGFIGQPVTPTSIQTLLSQIAAILAGP